MVKTARRKRKSTQLLMMLGTTWKKSSPLTAKLDDIIVFNFILIILLSFNMNKLNQAFYK